MYPESNYTPQQSDHKNTTRRRWLIIGVILFVLIVGVVIAFNGLSQSGPQQYRLTKTGLKSQQNFGYMNGSDVYAFNGLAFYKTNANDGKVTILTSGQRFPVPSNIYWANSKGALLSFSSSFALSAVENTLQAKGQQLTEEVNNYSWYLDFASGTLNLVNKSPIVAGQAYFSEKDQGFYYVTNESSKLGVTTPLYFYNIDAHQSKPISSDLEVTDMSSMTACPASDALCFTARDLSDTAKKKLYSIKQGEKKKVLFESDGQIFPTNNPELYIVVGRGSDPKKVSSEAPAGDQGKADLSDESANLYSLKTNSTIALDFKVGVSTPVLHFIDATHFYIIQGASDDDKTPSYRSGEISGDNAKTTIHPITYGDGTKFDTMITGVSSHGTGSQMLVTTTKDEQVLFNDAKQYLNLSAKTTEDANKIVRDCLGSGATDDQYFDEIKQFRVLFVADNNFTRNVASFSKCVIQADNSALNGYNFQFAGSDPFNGRISTD